MEKKAQTPRLVKIFQIILFLAFLVFGLGKFLTSPENASDVFGKIGGTLAQYVTGVFELISAILVIIPATASLGALMIVATMATAFILHLVVLGFAGPFAFLALLSLVFLAMAVYVFKKRRKDSFF